ncbi:putative necrosis-inducing factor-domain-containing protein [Hypoxylon sp. FL1150]|nr:putative necrosis-inducing factor-domain-containing protein [Hypoxylon sp. FL1150]
MLFKTASVALLSGAVLLVAAAPPPTSPAAAASALLRPRDACAADPSAGYCTTLTYNDRTKSDSPSGDACQNTCRSVLSDAGDWIVDFHGKSAGYHDTMVASTCSFAVSRVSDSDTSQIKFNMHNQDIIDVVGQAVSRFAGKHGGKVSADGTMNCSGNVVKWYVF